MKMLAQLNNFEFIEIIEGEYKYKESNIKKSNVYSLKLENTNLNYKLYSYNEMLIKLKAAKINISNLSENQIEKLLNGSISSSPFYNRNKKYYKIFDITEYKNANIYLKHVENIPLSTYYFYEANENTKEDIESEIKVKMQMRNVLNESIRKSIDRYMPVNTQLWKIEYEGI